MIKNDIQHKCKPHKIIIHSVVGLKLLLFTV